MVLRIDHVSIAVKDYTRALDFFTRVLGAQQGVGAGDRSMGYSWQMCVLGDLSRLELLTPTGPGSFLDGFLEGKEGGVHHITLQVQDIIAARNALDREKIPHFGYADYGSVWKELFIHPKDAFGVLIQLAEFRPDDWLPETAKMPSDQKYKVEKRGQSLALTVKKPGGGMTELELTHKEASELIEALKSELK